MGSRSKLPRCEPGVGSRRVRSRRRARDGGAARRAKNRRLAVSGQAEALSASSTRALSSLLGRDAEVATIEEVLERGRLGPALLIIEGEPGIGKTTLWREGIARAEGYRVLSCRAAQAEARLSFAALTDLLDLSARTPCQCCPPSGPPWRRPCCVRTPPTAVPIPGPSEPGWCRSYMCSQRMGRC